jgi:hypothetical protein
MNLLEQNKKEINSWISIYNTLILIIPKVLMSIIKEYISIDIIDKTCNIDENHKINKHNYVGIIEQCLFYKNIILCAVNVDTLKETIVNEELQAIYKEKDIRYMSTHNEIIYFVTMAETKIYAMDNKYNVLYESENFNFEYCFKIKGYNDRIYVRAYCNQKKIFVFDLRLELIEEIKMDAGEENTIRDFDFYNNSLYVATWDCRIIKYDILKSGYESSKTYEVVSECTFIIKFMVFDRYICIYDYNYIHIYDIETFKLQQQIKLHQTEDMIKIIEKVDNKLYHIYRCDNIRYCMIE